MGVIAYYRHQYQKALLFFLNAVELDGYTSSLVKNIGVILNEKGHLYLSEMLFSSILGEHIEVKRDGGEIDKEIAHWILKTRKAYQSREAFAISVETFLNQFESDVLYACKGEIALADGQLNEAEQLFSLSLSLNSQSEQAFMGLASVERTKGNYQKAFALAKDWLKKHPESHFVRLFLAELSLLFGHWKQGWTHFVSRVPLKTPYEYIVDPKTSMVAACPEYGSASRFCGKKVLLLHEQGIGDELFFLRFAPRLSERCHIAGYKASDKLAPFLSSAIKTVEVVNRADDLPDYDAVISVTDIPLVLGDSFQIESPMPLMLAEPLYELGLQLLEPFPRPWIGIVWEGGTKAINALHRQVPVKMLLGCFEDFAGTLFIVQNAPDGNALGEAATEGDARVVDLSKVNSDIKLLASVLYHLDDYIGVNNTGHHIRASFGKPSKVLVPHPYDYCLMSGGEISPWFPHNTLYRQSSFGDWKEPIAKLTKDIFRQWIRGFTC